MDTSLKYNTLSYTWGRCYQKRSIKYNGHDFKVTDNLYAALLRFRRLGIGAETPIWIDAICINQSKPEVTQPEDAVVPVDRKEKDEQIKMMGRIYSQARETIVWLGEADSETAMVWGLLTKLDEAGDVVSDIDGQEEWTRIGNGSEWAALDRLFKRLWFTRMWVWQEVALSNKRAVVYVGAYLIGWLQLTNIATLIHCRQWGCYMPSDSWQKVLLMSRASNIGYIRTNKEIKASMATLLILTRNAAATDPRDKIFGLANIGIAVTPNTELSLVQTYTRMSEWLLENTNDLILLSMVQEVQVRAEPADELPSWVPDWSMPYAWQPLDSTEDQFMERYQASKGTVAITSFDSARPGALSVRGFEIGTVDWIGDAQDFDNSRENVESPCLAIMQWELKVRSIGSEVFLSPFSTTGVPEERALYPRTSETYDKAFVRTLVTGHSTADPIIDGSADESKEAEYSADMRSATARKRFFVADDTCIGMAPPMARVGDLVVIFYGARVPYIIRRSGASFRMVGECYVHGVMKGEAMRFLEDDGEEQPLIRDFCLK
jgi:hypothetical protein